MNVGIVVAIDDDGRVDLRVDAGSTEMRRKLGVVAWSVLEVLALGGAVDGSGRWMTYSNARDLALGLGIGKDRTAAALGELRRAGLVAAEIGRDQGSARFARSRYEVRIPVSRNADTAATPSGVNAIPHSLTSSRSRRSRANDDTPNLFDQPS